MANIDKVSEFFTSPDDVQANIAQLDSRKLSAAAPRPQPAAGAVPRPAVSPDRITPVGFSERAERFRQTQALLQGKTVAGKEKALAKRAIEEAAPARAAAAAEAKQAAVEGKVRVAGEAARVKGIADVAQKKLQIEADKEARFAQREFDEKELAQALTISQAGDATTRFVTETESASSAASDAIKLKIAEGEQVTPQEKAFQTVVESAGETKRTALDNITALSEQLTVEGLNDEEKARIQREVQFSRAAINGAAKEQRDALDALEPQEAVATETTEVVEAPEGVATESTVTVENAPDVDGDGDVTQADVEEILKAQAFMKSIDALRGSNPNDQQLIDREEEILEAEAIVKALEQSRNKRAKGIVARATGEEA